MQRRIRATDDGATLVLVLVFVGVFGVLLAAVLNETSGGLKRTIVTRSFNEKVYAADAGIDAAIQTARLSDTLCPVTGSTGTLAPLTVNGKSVTVTCRTVSGSSLGAGGFALVTTDPTASSITTSGGGTKTIRGDIFASGLGNPSNFVVDHGRILEHNSTCSIGGAAPAATNWIPSIENGTAAGQTPVPPYSYACTGTSWNTVVPTVPSLGTPPLAHTALPDKVSGTCSIFRPGTYASGINLSASNYLSSGVYYFPTGQIYLKQKTLIGGAPASGDTNVNGDAACGSDADLTAAAAGKETIQGTGVTIVLGGDANLDVDNPGGRVEFFTRTGGGAGEGTQGVSLITVATTGGGWTASTRSLTQTVLLLGTGNTPAFSAHGLVYVPGHFIDFNATNDVTAQLVGGVVTGRLNLQSSASAGGLSVSLQSGPGRRRLELVSTASSPGERDIVSSAVIDIQNDSSRTIAINSWLTHGN